MGTSLGAHELNHEYAHTTVTLQCIPVKSHGFAMSLTMLAMKSRSHADYVIAHAFQLKPNL